jgi:glucosamine-6-phosphate deaminase
MGAAAANDVACQLKELLSQQRMVRAVFAAAASQTPFIDALVGLDGIDWGRIEVLQLDEYVGLGRDDPASLGHWLELHLPKRVHLARVEYMNGMAENLTDECARYEAVIQERPIDLGVIGIGENGHLAFNDPHVANFADPRLVKVVEIDETSRMQQVRDGAFPSIDVVPRRALTLTIPPIRAIRVLSVVVPGQAKAAAVSAALVDPVSAKCPASVLRTHSAATLYLDENSFADAQTRLAPAR